MWLFECNRVNAAVGASDITRLSVGTFRRSRKVTAGGECKAALRKMQAVLQAIEEHYKGKDVVNLGFLNA